jgi:GDP-4-dehydro-6-deoxy-D-mannose reductase
VQSFDLAESMKQAFITGISGFVGRHLTNYLYMNKWRVAGSDLQPAPELPAYFLADINDRAALQHAIRETRPDLIFHLAGTLKADRSEQFYEVHVQGTVSLLDALMENELRSKVIIASSGAVYGAGQGRRPIKENFKLRPVTHYAASKLAQEVVAQRYCDAVGLPVIRVRTFNLLGPGLSPQMACSSFARQIALAEKQGLKSTIKAGDLGAKRDFVDVRDAVRAYELLAEKGQAGQVYNVASGRPVSMRQCLDFLQSQARVPVEDVFDPARVQNNDISIQVGSAKRLQEQTGWEPEISIEQSLLDLLDDWRGKLETE